MTWRFDLPYPKMALYHPILSIFVFEEMNMISFMQMTSLTRIRSPSSFYPLETSPEV
jgi:hypothetical protein